MPSKLRIVTLLIVAAAATGYGQSSPSNRQWPPEVQKVSDESPALSPEEALKTFYMPPGYHLELVASEPLVQDPIVMDWDPQGRLFAEILVDVVAAEVIEPWGGGKWHMEIFRSVSGEPEDWNGEM